MDTFICMWVSLKTFPHGPLIFHFSHAGKMIKLPQKWSDLSQGCRIFLTEAICLCKVKHAFILYLKGNAHKTGICITFCSVQSTDA